MKRMIAVVAAGMITLMAAGTALASPPHDPVVKHREWNQHERIEQGVRSGQLTPAESRSLRAEQAHIRHVEAKMKADGHFTQRERRILHRMQDRASRHIHHEKHDAEHRF